MSKSGAKKDPALFMQSIEGKAEAMGFEVEPLTDKGKSLGLVVFETGQAMSYIARVIRNTALVLTEKEEGAEMRPVIPTDSCQVSVEERAQLFDFFAKGAGK